MKLTGIVTVVESLSLTVNRLSSDPLAIVTLSPARFTCVVQPRGVQAVVVRIVDAEHHVEAAAGQSDAAHANVRKFTTAA